MRPKLFDVQFPLSYLGQCPLSVLVSPTWNQLAGPIVVALLGTRAALLQTLATTVAPFPATQCCRGRHPERTRCVPVAPSHVAAHCQPLLRRQRWNPRLPATRPSTRA